MNMPVFTREDKYDYQKGYALIRWGERSKILDTELTELQKIMRGHVGALGKGLLTDGFMSKPAMTYASGTLTVPADRIVVEGVCIGIADPMTLTVPTGSTVYLAVWEQEVAYTDTIKRSGNQSGGVALADNGILDPTFGTETSRRFQTQVQLVTSNSDSSKTYLPVASISGVGAITDNRPSARIASEVLALTTADIPSLDTSKLGSGTLGVARGGTGAATFTAGRLLYGNGTSALGNDANLTYSSSKLSAPYITATGTTKTAGAFYAGTANPTSANRLNYDGNLHATMLYEGGTALADKYGTITSVSAALNSAKTYTDDHANVSNAPHGATSAATPSRIMARDAFGRAKATAPVADDDVARKKEVDDAMTAVSGVQSSVNVHTARIDNPHGVTKTQVGLGSVPNYPAASKAEAEAATASDRIMAPVRVKEYVDTRLQNGIHWRISGGVPEYFNGTSWVAFSGGGSKMLVASNNVRETVATERSNAQNSGGPILVHKFVPKGPGEIFVSAEIRGINFTYRGWDEEEPIDVTEQSTGRLYAVVNAANKPNRGLPENEAREYNVHPITSTLGGLSYLTPVGSVITGDVIKRTMDGFGDFGLRSNGNIAYQSFSQILTIIDPTPIYFFFVLDHGWFQEDSQNPMPIAYIRNLQIRYDEV